jgi:hypothetical protein
MYCDLAGFHGAAAGAQRQHYGRRRCYNLFWRLRVTATGRHDRRLFPFPYEFLGRAATRIINEVPASTASSTNHLQTSRPDRAG